MKFLKREIVYENLYSDIGILISNKRTKTEIIRCSSCRHWTKGSGANGTCALNGGLKNPGENDFCSRGVYGDE